MKTSCLLVHIKSNEDISSSPVLITDAKKPAGAAKEIESYFGCSASDLVLVGVTIISYVFSYSISNVFTLLIFSPLFPGW